MFILVFFFSFNAVKTISLFSRALCTRRATLRKRWRQISKLPNNPNVATVTPKMKFSRKLWIGRMQHLSAKIADPAGYKVSGRW